MPDRRTLQTPRGRSQAAKAGLYRTLVVEAAEGLFAERGVRATRMEDISEAAGLSLSTVYSVLDGKSAIVEAVHDTRINEVVTTAQKAAADSSPLAGLLTAVRTFCGYFMEHPDYLKLYLSHGRSWVTPIRDGSDEQNAWERGYALQVGLVDWGVESGVFHRERPEFLADTLIAMYQAALARWLEEGMSSDQDEVLEAIERQIRRSLCVHVEDRPE